jgi:O-succinylbenzoate synthase
MKAPLLILGAVGILAAVGYSWWRQAPNSSSGNSPLPPPARLGSTTGNESGLASETFATVVANISQLPEAEQEMALREALGEWALSEPAAALAWLEEHPLKDQEAQAARQAALAISWAEGTPAEAATFALENISPATQSQKVAVVAVVQRWAQQDGSAAAKFVSALPDSPLRTNAATELVAIWAEQDVQPPAQWIESLTDPSPLRDACTDRLARELAAEAPDAAQAWAQRIRTPQLREQCLQSIAELNQ